MDPLSIAASVIAVLQAAGATGSILQKLIELGHADEEFLLFVNEVTLSRGCYNFNGRLIFIQVSNLQTALTAVDATLRRAAERGILDDTSADCFRKEDDFRIQASTVLSDIDDILRKALKNTEIISGASRSPNVSKRAWFFSKKKILKKRSRIKHITDSMMVTLMSFDILLGLNLSS